MREKNFAADQEAAEEEYQELKEEDLIPVDKETGYPPYDEDNDVSGVRNRADIEGKNVTVFSELNDRVNTFTEAVQSSKGREKEILQGQLDKLIGERDEALNKLSDDEAVRVGFGQQRAEELKINTNSLLEEYKRGGLSETDKTVLKGKVENATTRMKKIVDGFNEDQKEKFTAGLSAGQVKDLDLERQAIRRLDRSINSYDAILKEGNPTDRKRVKDNKNRLLAERKAIWESMSEEEVREKYGIKTSEEFLAEQKGGKEQEELDKAA